jgi:5'-3' exonuclease
VKRVILLDADVPAYQFAAVGQKEIQWEEDGEITPIPLPLELVEEQMLDWIADLREHLKADRLIVALSDPDKSANWRKRIMPAYKLNRTLKVHPVHRAALEAVLAEHFESYRRDTLEGDDVLGILATNRHVIKGEKILVSIDKDMQTIPTREQRGSINYLFNPGVQRGGVYYKRDKEPRVITELEADWYQMYQALIGDTVDGYKGCPKVGPVAAKALLGDPADFPDTPDTRAYWWREAVGAFESKGFGPRLALQQAQVARICRAGDFNYSTKEVIPWHPPKTT